MPALERTTEPVVGQRVRSAHRALGVARGVECCLIGVGVALGTLAVMAWERNALQSIGAWSVAIGCGVLAAATWWFENRQKPAGVARRLDRKLGLDGMLFTAWEVEEEAQGVGGLLSARVARKVSWRRALDAVLPASAPLVVLPFVGAGLLAFVLDARGVEEDPTERLLELTRSARGHISDARGGELKPEVQERLEALGVASDALFEDSERPESAESAAAIDEILKEIERLREEMPAGEEAARALDQAEELFEAARLALGEEGSDTDAWGSGSGSEAEEETEGGREGGRGGTMGGLDPGTEPIDEGAAHSAWEGPEGALGPGTHWPEEQRGVVRRWVEERRIRNLESND